ncbi:unnamed protein product [Penicillium olsonii]|uniref:NTP binding protein n=1 Tax=Penicillium olsonii TaxID=99116 RepID=A0A9W4HPB1_PENOL|nr:unnamed protein product [Penicillium olsonii]CAG8081713.1 unnamed protein product [Penicillium olsonii]
MAATRVELPDGHLVNLSPRPVRAQYQAYRADYKASPTELSAITPPRYTPIAKPNEQVTHANASSTAQQKPKNTKLPVPKSSANSPSHESRQTPSPTGLPKPTTPKHTGQRAQGVSAGNRDQYMQKLRDRFEKDSPLSERSDRSKNSDSEQSPNARKSYHRPRPPTGNRPQQAQTRGANARSAIPSPSTAKSSPASASARRVAASQPVDSKNKWRKQGDQWINMDVPDNTPQKSEKTETTSASTPQTQSSVSPLSAEDSSITDCDWEDRFVVNMPSAKDPNPPTMTAQQISEYQKSIEKVYQAGGKMAHPDSLPSRNASPESKSSLRGYGEQTPPRFMAYDGAYEERQLPKPLSLEHREIAPQKQDQAQSPQRPQPQAQPPMQTKVQSTVVSQRQTANNYYSPDEIGHTRISTIWEESPTKIKEKRHPQNADGSFLGCREISGEKNPDEILMFTPPDDANLHPRPLALVSKNMHRGLKNVKKGGARKTAQIVPEATIIQDEPQQSAPSSIPTQCPKSSTTSRDQPQPADPTPVSRKGSQDSGKENSYLPSSPIERSESLGESRSDDDVFIITPTITRTMLPAPDKKPSAPKPQGLRRAGGASQPVTAEATRAIRAKAQIISTPSGLRPGGLNSKVKPTGSTLTASQTFPSSALSSTGNDQGPVDRGQQDRTQEPISDKTAATASSTIRGFIRTSGLARSSGLVRSPTDSLAAILRSGTESLRNRAESLRNGSGSLQRSNRKITPSQPSTIPQRDNSESSRSAKSLHSLQSFDTAKEQPGVPEDAPPSPKPVKIEEKPQEPSSPPRKSAAPSKPASRKLTLSEDPPSKVKLDKPPTSTRRISALAKPSKLDKTSKASKTPAPEKPSPPKVEAAPKKESPPRKDEKQRTKTLPRLSTSSRVTDVAELDGLQLVSPKESVQPNLNNLHSDLGDTPGPNNAGSDNNDFNPLALSLVFHILVVAITQVNRFVRMGTDSSYAKFVLNNTLSMTGHCFNVFSCIYGAFRDYQATGSWPKPQSDKAISRFMMDLLQAVVYLFILGFAATLVGRVAGYVVLVSSWIVWVAKPFAWVFQFVGRVLIAN